MRYVYIRSLIIECTKSESWVEYIYYLVGIDFENENGTDDDLSFFFDIELTIFFNFEAKASWCFSEFRGGEHGGVTVITFLFFWGIAMPFVFVDFDDTWLCREELDIYDSGEQYTGHDFGEGGAFISWRIGSEGSISNISVNLEVYDIMYS